MVTAVGIVFLAQHLDVNIGTFFVLFVMMCGLIGASIATGGTFSVGRPASVKKFSNGTSWIVVYSYAFSGSNYAVMRKASIRNVKFCFFITNKLLENDCKYEIQNEEFVKVKPIPDLF